MNTSRTPGSLTGYTDSLGVDILVGDTVTSSSWGAPVRLTDTGRRATVIGVNRAGNLVLDDPSEPLNPIAGGRGVRPGYVLVARRDGERGHEGNRTA